MKYLIALIVLFSFVTVAVATPLSAEAKGGSYYKSAKSGRFVKSSYSSSHKSTTYKSYFK
jgi:hypothetical protein